jgi:hypothetical protein
VSWFSSLTESQATIIVGILTVVAQPLFLLVAFFLGKAQGRAQVRHERAADAVVAAVRVVADLRAEVGMWAILQERDELESKSRGTILRLRQELRNLVYDNSPWLDLKTERKLKPVIYELRSQYDAHDDALTSGDPARITETGERLAEWNTRNLTQMQLDLEDEARRLIGSKRHWTLTWWGKPLAWFTRTTRYFVARNWVRRNLGWLAAVPGTALATALAAFVIYSLVAR